MQESRMSEIIRASLDGVKDFADMDTVVGNAVTTPNGVTVIPVSRISVGFATGGLDYGSKRSGDTQNFGGGGGTGVSITPIAFLTIGKNAEVSLIPLSQGGGGFDRVASFIEKTPDLIEKIKEALT